MYKVGLLELELDEIKMQFHAVFTCCFPVIHPPELFTFSLPPINIGPSFPYTFPLYRRDGAAGLMDGWLDGWVC